jgi:acyl-CoA thioesterase
MWSVLLFLLCFIRFVCVTQMFIFSLDYEMWFVLLFLFCFMHFVFVTQMFIFSLDYEMWSVKQTTFHNLVKR